ncbi:uncharacterized protein [Spinacia oleracea]|uniref:Reverse transcriptase zinc-binding domain-containing protein n=1 Tax=Spinacia oleracea TaxID=3562 RepID=A0ABM3R4E5_SPIOL|nr:uncharacterized protein LOC110806033 [Spinacia oleracea]
MGIETSAQARKWKVEDLIDKDNNIWKGSVIRQRFEWRDAKDILAMDLPRCPTSDFVYWKHNSKGKYTVKSGYEVLLERRSMGEDKMEEGALESLKIIWRSNILPKWKVFIWRITYDALAVNYNLKRRGIDIDSQCDYCGFEEEDSHHIFRTCSVARLAWTLYQPQVQTDDDEPMSVVKWVQRNIRLFYSKDEVDNKKLEEFVIMLWSLWVTRNGRVFRNIGGHVASVLFQAKEAMKCLQTFKNRSLVEAEDKDPSCPPGFHFVNLGENKHLYTNFVLQVDGSWEKETKRAGWGWAYKDGRNRNNVGVAHNIANKCRKEGLMFSNRI